MREIFKIKNSSIEAHIMLFFIIPILTHIGMVSC